MNPNEMQMSGDKSAAALSFATMLSEQLLNQNQAEMMAQMPQEQIGEEQPPMESMMGEMPEEGMEEEPMEEEKPDMEKMHEEMEAKMDEKMGKMKEEMMSEIKEMFKTLTDGVTMGKIEKEE